MRFFPDLSKPNATAEEVAHERKQMKRFVFLALFLIIASFGTEYVNSLYSQSTQSAQKNTQLTPTITETVLPSPSPTIILNPSPMSTPSVFISPSTSPTKSLVPITSMKACPMDAKLCPDGKTYVGRSGPICEFVACPK